ncbi:hypothetical protein T266_07375 [Pseudomonas aeruginosa VRFPA05]|nr:hypothetical protein T266_07375 [Pseudomonas aeruginosa VRFPA05]
MRAGLLLSLAWADYRGEARLSLCAIFALAAVITPLLVLFGLKYGLVSTLTERLERAPSVREIIPVGGARYRAEDIAALAARADVAFAVPRTRQIAATADLSGATLGAGGGAAAGFASAAEGAFARGAPPTWCCRALKTFRQVPQRTAPLAAPSCASLTRKLVLQWGHWVMTLSLMRRSVGKIRRLVYPKLLARRQWGGISGGWRCAINRRGGGR